MSARLQGKLVTWKSDKGFGFIRPDDGSKDVFVHLRDFGDIARTPRIGDVIRYQRIGDGNERFRAADVHIVGLPRGAAAAAKPRRRGNAGSTATGNVTWRWLVVAVFAATLAACVAFTPLPLIVVVVYLVASLVTWILYAFDKAAAMNNRWRTSEGALLMIGLLGGWPGALLAQGMFRHKSRKTAFLVPFWITVAANCAVLIWACSGNGAATIRDLVY